MKKIFLILITLLVIGCGSKKEEKYTLRLGHIGNEDTDWQKTAVMLADYVKKESDGRLEIMIYPNGQLGSELDTIREIHSQTADMTITLDSLQNWNIDEVGVVGLPYLIESSEEMEAIAEGPVGQEIEKAIIEKAKVRPILWMERMPRYLTSNKPIQSTNDLNNFIIRVPNVPMYAKVWEGLGAKPTPMAFTEVFTSLQQNTIHGQENPLSLINSAGFYEVQKYAYETDHVRQWIYSVVGVKQFNALSPELQKIVKDSAKEAQDYAQNKFVAYQKEVKQDLISKGMIIRKMDQAAMRAKVLPKVEEILTPEQFDLYKRIQDVK